MKKTRQVLFVFCLVSMQMAIAQSVSLKGSVYATSEVEGIHVINKTARKATTTNKEGQFTIQVNLSDTLVFSGVQYKLHSILVDKAMIDTKTVKIFLIENINQLDEVLVGQVLTGDLESDIENANVKPDINFYDVGIPGYQGKMPTQSERELREAGEFKPIMLLGLLAGGMPLNPIINGLSGRTKMLKQRVELERKDELMYRAKAKISESLFAEDPLDERLHYEFFQYCSEDPNFETECNLENDFETLAFFQKKLKAFKVQIEKR